jgi:hypothetical protein
VAGSGGVTMGTCEREGGERGEGLVGCGVGGERREGW